MAWQVFKKVFKCKSCGNIEQTGERQVQGRRAGNPTGPVHILKEVLLLQPHPCRACGQPTEQFWQAKSGDVVTRNQASDLATKAQSDDPDAMEVIARG